MASHLPNGLKHEMECDDVQHDNTALKFTSIDCAVISDESKVIEQSVDDYITGSLSYDPMDFERSQYLKEEADDPIDG